MTMMNMDEIGKMRKTLLMLGMDWPTLTDELVTGRHTYKLTRDEQLICTGTLRECWAWIHDTHPFSVHHALTHEGYAIVES
jgi:hypothetical protein